MAWRFEDLQAQARELERIAVFHRGEGVLGLRAGAESNRGTAAVAQLQMPGDEIGMEMREEDVADGEAELCGVGQVLLDIALRINDDRSSAGLVSDEIRCVREAAQVVLLQNHPSIV